MVDNLTTAVKALNQSFDEFLMSRAAVKLAGKPVLIEYSELDDCRGQTIKRNAVMVIQLDPAQLDNENDMLETFLHETAHVKLHADAITDQKHVPGAVINPANTSLLYKLRRNAENKRETEARELAARWLINSGGGTLRERLNRLLSI